MNKISVKKCPGLLEFAMGCSHWVLWYRLSARCNHRAKTERLIVPRLQELKHVCAISMFRTWASSSSEMFASSVESLTELTSTSWTGLVSRMTGMFSLLNRRQSVRLQLTAVCAAELRRKGNVINRHASAAWAVKGHFKDHLQGHTHTHADRAQEQRLVPTRSSAIYTSVSTSDVVWSAVGEEANGKSHLNLLFVAKAHLAAASRWEAVSCVTRETVLVPLADASAVVKVMCSHCFSFQFRLHIKPSKCN